MAQTATQAAPSDFLAMIARVKRDFELAHWSRVLQRDCAYLMQLRGMSAAALDLEMVGQVKFYAMEVA